MNKKWNWPIILILLTTICIWVSIWYIGFWITLIYLLIGICTAVIGFKLRENTRV